MIRLPPHIIAVFYLLYALLAVPLAAVLMPPFQNADEPNHLLRADQVSHGRLLCKPLSPAMCGGKVDAGLHNTDDRFDKIPFDRGAKVTRGMYAAVPWGHLLSWGFSNTAIYPPFFYLPASGALLVSRWADVTVLHGVLAARLAMAAVSIAVGALAIALAGDAAILLFTILLLPMGFCLTSAVSQDGPMLASAALSAALCRRAHLARMPARNIGIGAVLLGLVAMARPPYVAFALLPGAARLPWWARLAAAGAVIAATLGWALLNIHRLHVPDYAIGAIDPGRQLVAVVHDPGHFAGVLVRTWRRWGSGLLGGFIGEPGWLDVDLPWWYQCVAWAAVAGAFVVCLYGARLWSLTTLILGAAIFAACLGLALVQYMTQSAVGDAEIGGLQGRYFLVPAMMIAALAPRERPDGRRIRFTTTLLLAFPIISIPVTIQAIVGRYYY